MSQMDLHRHLCSQLVMLSWNDGSQMVNLEEVWETGGMLECEGAVPEGVQAQIGWGDVMLAGRVTDVTKHEFGWRVSIEFSPLTPWTRLRGAPAHLLDLDAFED